MKAVVALLVCAAVASANPRLVREERELLDRKNKNSLTWENFPLRTYPQWTGPAPKTDAAAQRAAKRLMDKREEFTERHLRGRLFGGLATITSVKSQNGKYEITAEQRYEDDREELYKSMREADQIRAEARYLVTGRGNTQADNWDIRHRCTWVSDERLKTGIPVVLHGEIDTIDLDSSEPRITEIQLKNVKIQEH